MFAGQKDHVAGQDSRSQDVRERHLYSRLWHRLFGRARSRRQKRPQRLSAPERRWSTTAARRQQLLHPEHAGHTAGLPGWRAGKWSRGFGQRPNLSVAFGGILLTLVCGLGCRDHESSRASSENPQTSFHDAQQTLEGGDLVRAQSQAEDGLKRYLSTSPAWARKFRILEAEVVLVRGNDYRRVLSLLDAGPNSQDSRDSVIKVLALRSLALARLQEFDEANLNLQKAEAL